MATDSFSQTRSGGFGMREAASSFLIPSSLDLFDHHSHFFVSTRDVEYVRRKAWEVVRIRLTFRTPNKSRLLFLPSPECVLAQRRGNSLLRDRRRGGEAFSIDERVLNVNLGSCTVRMALFGD